MFYIDSQYRLMRRDLNQEKKLQEKYYYLWVTLARARDAIYRCRETELAQFGISPEQALILVIVRSLNNHATPAEISRHIFRRPNTVSVIVSGMVKKGLLKKGKDLHRRNLVRISLTEKGEDAYQRTTIQKSILKMMSSMSEAEVDKFQYYVNLLLARAKTELGMENIPILPVGPWSSASLPKETKLR